jgi:alpha-tubulin suppressor-like RCC1 family protein
VNAFLNGVSEGEVTVSNGVASITSRLAIGNQLNGSFGFVGQVAEILIYNRALTSAEAQQLGASLQAKYGQSNSMSEVFAGADQAATIDSNGILRVWGNNSLGQLGDGTLTNRAQMKKVTGVSGKVLAMAYGQAHALAITESAQVLAWGDNYVGQLGNGTSTGSRTAIALAGISAKQVAAGDEHSLALLPNGTVYAWGGNSSGQLGDGTQTTRLIPTLVSGLTDVVSIAAGAKFSVAVTSAGAVWVWGANDFGQLATADLPYSTVPVPVTSLGAVKTLVAGRHHILALRADGTVVAWGAGYAGQLANGTLQGSYVPQTISGLTGVVKLAAGGRHSIALNGSGGVWVWGANESGQLGDGTLIAKTSATAVATLFARRVATGRDHTVIIKTDGSIVSFGANGLQQLGSDRSDTVSANPIPVLLPLD